MGRDTKRRVGQCGHRREVTFHQAPPHGDSFDGMALERRLQIPAGSDRESRGMNCRTNASNACADVKISGLYHRQRPDRPLMQYFLMKRLNKVI